MGLDRAINEFAAAAASAQAWPEALQALAEGLGADGATLTRGPSSPIGMVASRGIREIVEEYFAFGMQIDTRERRVMLRPVGGFTGDFDNFTPEEIERDPFYTEFLRPRGFGWHANAALNDGPDALLLNLKRHWSRGPYQRDDLRRISTVLPHLRAAAHHAAIGLGDRARDDLARLSDRGQGGLLLDMHGAAICWNPEMAFGDGLSLHDRRLVTGAGADQAGLNRAIDLALAPGPASDLPAPAACAIRRPSGKRPLVVRVATLAAGAANPVAQARALVSVLDPDARRPAQTSLLREVFGLTPREADIADLLCDGLSLAEIAARVRITLPHARQRLKIILQKTETTRQGELIALLSRLH